MSEEDKAIRQLSIAYLLLVMFTLAFGALHPIPKDADQFKPPTWLRG